MKTLLLALLFVLPARAQVDYDRLLYCICEVEATPWSHPGGALGFTRGAWQDTTDLPYRLACDKDTAFEVGEIRLAYLAQNLRKNGIRPDPYQLGTAWHLGLAGALDYARRNDQSDYGRRIRNIYESDFEP